MSSNSRDQLDRRAFLRVALGAPLAIPAAGALLGAMACGGQDTTTAEAPPAAPPAPAAPKAPPVPAAPAAPAGGDAVSAGGEGGEKKLVTEVPASAALVSQLQYVNESAKPDQNCTNCMFYSDEGGGLGKCQLFPQGYVKAAGWCMSWAKKA